MAGPDPIEARIARAAGVAGLVERLARLPGADLRSLLVFRRRAAGAGAASVVPVRPELVIK